MEPLNCPFLQECWAESWRASWLRALWADLGWLETWHWAVLRQAVPQWGSGSEVRWGDITVSLHNNQVGCPNIFTSSHSSKVSLISFYNEETRYWGNVSWSTLSLITGACDPLTLLGQLARKQGSFSWPWTGQMKYFLANIPVNLHPQTADQYNERVKPSPACVFRSSIWWPPLSLGMT